MRSPERLDFGTSASALGKAPRPPSSGRMLKWGPSNVHLPESELMAAGENQWYHFGVGAPPI